MTVTMVRLEDMVQSRSTQRLVVQRVHHAIGDVRPSTPSPFAALHHDGGNLRPPLRDVRGRVAVSAPVPALPRATLFQKSVSPISGYCFQHRTKSLAVYIATLTPGKWDSWRDDLVIMQAEVYDRLVLPTAVPMVIASAGRRFPICSRPTS
jgi:hypothetical protein